MLLSAANLGDLRGMGDDDDQQYYIPSRSFKDDDNSITRSYN